MLFEANARKIKQDSLGGLDSKKAKLFNEELTTLKSVYSNNNKAKDTFIKAQINKAPKIDAMLKEQGISVLNLVEKNVLL